MGARARAECMCECVGSQRGEENILEGTEVIEVVCRAHFLAAERVPPLLIAVLRTRTNGRSTLWWTSRRVQ